MWARLEDRVSSVKPIIFTGLTPANQALNHYLHPDTRVKLVLNIRRPIHDCIYVPIYPGLYLGIQDELML